MNAKKSGESAQAIGLFLDFSARATLTLHPIKPKSGLLGAPSHRRKEGNSEKRLWPTEVVAGYVFRGFGVGEGQCVKSHPFAEAKTKNLAFCERMGTRRQSSLTLAIC